MENDYSSECKRYDCEENDNYIMVRSEDGELDEIGVGCEWLPEHGETVIGIKDLNNALGKMGYKIMRVADVKLLMDGIDLGTNDGTTVIQGIY